MIETEFTRRWLPHHTAQFTGILSWLGKVPKVAAPGMPSQADVLKAWYRQLSRLDMEDAIAASDELAHSPEDLQPRSFDRHPAAILAIARRLRRDRGAETHRPQYVDGRETFRCTTCQDTGAIVVWHPRTVADMKAGRFQRGRSYTCSKACTCEAGNKYRWLGMFNADWMLEVKPWQPNEDQEADLAAFAAGLDERRLATKRHREFDAFSGAKISGRDRAAGETRNE